MAFFCKNAQEEALKEIAWQMKIANILNIERELYEKGAVSEELHIKSLKELMNVAK